MNRLNPNPIMVKKKDKGGGGSVSSTPGSETEDTPQAPNITPGKVNNPPEGGTESAPGSPEVLSQQVQTLQDTVEKNAEKITEMFAIFSSEMTKPFTLKRVCNCFLT